MKKISNKVKQQMVFLICCFSFLYTQAQPQYISENAEISVLTCGTGDEMYTLFGHTALRVQDTIQGLDVVYNWGMFDFDTPNFYPKFVKGDLLYYLGVNRFDDFLESYTEENREVVEQVLQLSYDQKTKIWEEINRQLNSEERYYTYSFIHNNCTTKVVDVLNKVLEQPLSTDFPSNKNTYRVLYNEGLDAHYFEKLGINLLFGYGTDQQAALISLPVKLKDGIDFNKKILKSEERLNQVSNVENASSFNSIYTLWGIVILVALGSFSTNIRGVYFFLTTIFGLFLLAVSLYTQHVELHYNVLVLFFNPLFLFGLSKKRRKIFNIAAILAVISLFFMGIELVTIVLPLILLHFSYVFGVFIRNKKVVSLHA